MKSHLQVHYLKHHSPEWYAFRENGFGGSELGAILGLSPWRSSLEVFHEKVGIFEKPRIENELMFHGSEMEDYIANLWQYWGSDGEFIENFRSGNIQRRCKRVNGYIVNPKYPWLFASVDRLINKNMPDVINWEIMDEEKVLECKTISGWLVRVWESGIPPYHLCQTQSYMIILEVDYSELAVLVDGRKLEVYGVRNNKEFAEKIIDVTNELWNKRVLPARELYAPIKSGEVKEGTHEYEDRMAQIYQLEPDPDGSEAYKNYMNERYREKNQPKEGTAEDEQSCREIARMQSIKKVLDERELLMKNRLRASMGEFDEMVLTDGKVTWRSNSKGSRVMRIYQKPDEHLVKEVESITDKILKE